MTQILANSQFNLFATLQPCQKLPIQIPKSDVSLMNFISFGSSLNFHFSVFISQCGKIVLSEKTQQKVVIKGSGRTKIQSHKFQTVIFFGKEKK